MTVVLYARVSTVDQTIAHQRIQAEAATRQREADVAHKRKINRAAREAIVKVIKSVAGSSGDQETTTAQAIVEAIARKEIPGAHIDY